MPQSSMEFDRDDGAAAVVDDAGVDDERGVGAGDDDPTWMRRRTVMCCVWWVDLPRFLRTIYGFFTFDEWDFTQFLCSDFFNVV